MLTSRGTRLILDPEDAARLSGRTLREEPGGTVRAYNPETGRSETLGRYLLGLRPGDTRHVRHRDGDRTDFRRSNLVAVSREKSYSLRDRRAAGERSAERLAGANLLNPRKSTSAFRGVTKVHPNGDTQKAGYQARVTVRGKTHASYHSTEEEAARAYDRLRLKHGLAAVNFPGEGA